MGEVRDTGSAAERTLQVLEAIATAGRAVTLADLAKSLALPKPTVHRLVRLLEEQGFVAKDLDGRALVAGPRMAAMAASVIHNRLSWAPCRAVLERLSRRVDETCNLVQLDGTAMRYVDRVETAWPLRLSFQVGQQVPVHCTATGKILLALQPARVRRRIIASLDLAALTERTFTDPETLEAELERIRRQGYGTDDQEFVPNMVAVAVPILPPDGPPVAAVSIHAPVVRRTLPDLIGFLPHLREAAARIAEAAYGDPEEPAPLTRAAG